MERLLRRTILIWTLALILRMEVVHCDKIYPGEVLDEDEDTEGQSLGEGQVNYDLNNDSFDWDNAGGPWAALGQFSSPSSMSASLGGGSRFSISTQPGALFKNKRAVFGILGLATKRPHKTAAEVNHLPPDSFLPTRGKKRSAGQVLLPSSAYLLRAAYPYSVLLRSRRSLIR